MIKLFDQQQANGHSETANYHSRPAWLVVAGNLGGGTVSAQIQAPDGTWVDLVGSSQNAAGAQLLQAPKARLRLHLQGASSAKVSAWLI